MTSKKTTLVTGCAGFVGGHLSHRLLKMGHTVIGVDDLSSGNQATIASLHTSPGFCFIEADFTSPGLLDRIFREHGPIDAVYHLAAIISIPYSMEHPDETVATNYHGTSALHADCRKLGVPTFVFAGSAAEYGDCIMLPLREEYADEHVSHLSPYGRSKWLATRHIERSGYGCTLRFFNIYGPQQPTNSPYSGVITIFASCALQGKPLPVHGSGCQARDFLFIDDAINAYLMAAGFDGLKPLSGTYNVATGDADYIATVAKMILHISKGGKIEYTIPRAGDICWSMADMRKLSATGRFTPTVTLEMGIRETMRWLALQSPTPQPPGHEPQATD